MSAAEWEQSLTPGVARAEDKAHLALAQAEVVGVDKEAGQVEELRSEFLDVAAVHQAVLPGGRHAGKQPVRVVKPPSLLTQEAVLMRTAFHMAGPVLSAREEDHGVCRVKKQNRQGAALNLHHADMAPGCDQQGELALRLPVLISCGALTFRAR